MPGPTFTVAELADEIGRSASYVYEHWRDLAKRREIPHPLNGGGSPLVWSRAQVYALIDKGLTRDERIAAAAFRAAAAAASETRITGKADLNVIDAAQILDRRFARKEGADA